MRLSARGGIVTGGGQGWQGKFCHCWKFVLFSGRDDFLPANADPLQDFVE
jgi:hypothetical protein